MKTRNLVLLTIVSLFSFIGCNEPVNDGLLDGSKGANGFVYPVRPGSETWKSFTSHEQMVEACQVPEEILKNMSTNDVIESVLENPMYGDLFAYNGCQDFYDKFSTWFNAFKELESREEAASELIKMYCAMEYQYDDLSAFSYWGGKGCVPGVAFLCIEILLAQEVYIDMASNEELGLLSYQILDTYNARIEDKNPNALFLSIGQNSAAWVASRIMEKYQYEGWLDLKASNDNYPGFLRMGQFSGETAPIMAVFVKFLE